MELPNGYWEQMVGGVVENAGWVFLVLVPLLIVRFVVRSIHSIFVSNLNRYCGAYTGCRSANTPKRIIFPKVKIKRSWRGDFHVYWYPPGVDEPSIMKLEDAKGTRYLTASINNKKNSKFGSLIIYENPRKDLQFLIGHYAFLNSQYSSVCGNFVLVREGLDPHMYLEKIRLQHIQTSSDTYGLLLDTFELINRPDADGAAANEMNN